MRGETGEHRIRTYDSGCPDAAECAALYHGQWPTGLLCPCCGAPIGRSR